MSVISPEIDDSLHAGPINEKLMRLSSLLIFKAILKSLLHHMEIVLFKRNKTIGHCLLNTSCMFYKAGGSWRNSEVLEIVYCFPVSVKRLKRKLNGAGVVL